MTASTLPSDEHTRLVVLIYEGLGERRGPRAIQRLAAANGIEASLDELMVAVECARGLMAATPGVERLQ